MSGRALGSIGFSERVAAYGEFVETGVPLFESEDLTDALIGIFVGLMGRGWAAPDAHSPLPLESLAQLYAQGLWLPCVKRVALAGQIDARNDGLPDYAALPLQTETGQWNFAWMRRVDRLPRGWAAPAVPRAVYHYGKMFASAAGRVDRRALKMELARDLMAVHGWYFVMAGDRLVPAACRDGSFPVGWGAGDAAIIGAACLQARADFQHLWVVETEEAVLGSERRTPLRLGCDAEIVKSLFYARQAPRAVGGRRRPILHWVSAHLRRLRLGAEVEISRHLRGVTEFDMDGFGFRITQPVKMREPRQ